MRILITGGAGLIGSSCAQYYAKKRVKVVVLDNLMRSKLFSYNKKSVEYNWQYLEKFKNITLIKGDVRKEKDVLKALGKGVDAVIHTAGQPGVPSSVRMPLEDFSINAFGTLNVLECVRKRCKKAVFVYCSTNKVYGENVDNIPLRKLKTRYMFKNLPGITENMPTDLTGHTPYGVSKLAGDLYTQEYARIYGLRSAVFRMSCIYGQRQFGFEDQGWVAWFAIACLTNKKITIYGNGAQVRDLLYTHDLVRAYDQFIQGNHNSDVFNIGGGKQNTISLIEFIAYLEQITGKKIKCKFRDWRPSDQKVYISDISKAEEKLHWKPLITIEDGLNRLIKWVQENKELF
ncbi:MAG: nucleoside-diphosphate sugar epimerase [Candidatus Omnitrophota bacterium]|nr:MAG: nucleoside-diphosphate sugar epimerase [Candidatus Omnitrophota bacterium]